MEQMKPKFSTIAAHANPQAGIAYAMFEIARDYLLGICESFHGGKIVLCGGVQINMAQPCEDYFEPLFFEVFEEGKKVADLMHVFETDLSYAE